MKKSNLIVNSSIFFIIASIIEMTLHELGHFIFSLALGGNPILFHNQVVSRNVDIPLFSHILIAAGGPLFSLAIGIICYQILKRRKVTLFTIYMSIFGFIGILGYMMTAPFFSYGDMGYILKAINCPMWLNVILAISSALLLYFIMRKIAVFIIALMSKRTAENKKMRSNFIGNLIMIPLFFGIFFTTIFNLPVGNPLSLIAPLASPFTILWVYNDYINANPVNIVHDEKEFITRKISFNWILTAIITIMINRMLTWGFSF